MITVLLIESNEVVSNEINQIMKAAVREEFKCFIVSTFEDATKFFTSKQLQIDAVLIGPTPNSSTVSRVDLLKCIHSWFFTCGHSVPLIVIRGEYNKSEMLDFMSSGVDDYICQDEIVPGVLCRSIRYGIDKIKMPDIYFQKSRTQLEQAQRTLTKVAGSVNKLLCNGAICVSA